jgi:MoxR-like ATPase
MATIGELVQNLLATTASFVLTQPGLLETFYAGIFARCHILLEDIPGVGKTTLAQSAAYLLGLDFQRIQFTSDMLPSDVLGMHRLDPKSQDLTFKRGPLFSNLVLADEINRASPKTQSATLEAMGEGSITIDGQSHILPQPFIVIATQNPIEHYGAYPLPESQLDRFGICLSLGYPSPAHERQLLKRQLHSTHEQIREVKPILNSDTLLYIQSLVEKVSISEPIQDYLLAIVHETRTHPDIRLGCSPRGTLMFAALCRGHALVCGRKFVTPEDVKMMAHPLLTHRLLQHGDGHGPNPSRKSFTEELLARIPAPR